VLFISYFIYIFELDESCSWSDNRVKLFNIKCKRNSCEKWYTSVSIGNVRFKLTYLTGFWCWSCYNFTSNAYRISSKCLNFYSLSQKMLKSLCFLKRIFSLKKFHRILLPKWIMIITCQYYHALKICKWWQIQQRQTRYFLVVF
jgi:hypothetical protein